MWGVVFVCLLFRVTEVLGQNVIEFSQREDMIDSTGGIKAHINDSGGKLNEVKITRSKFRSLLDNLADWTSLTVGEISGTQTTQKLIEGGRRLKYKKSELKFLIKLLIILKVILGIIFPLGVIASKILSWKAVTLSLMAFMLAKILFVKNLLTVKNTYSVAPANLVPSFLIHGAPNDVFWKRQGDAQNVYPWNSA